MTTSVCGALCDVGHTSNQCPGQECDPHPDVGSLTLGDGQATICGRWGRVRGSRGEETRLGCGCLSKLVCERPHLHPQSFLVTAFLQLL